MSSLTPDVRRWRQPWRWVPFPVRLAWARVRGRAIRHRILRRVAAVLVVGLVALWTLVLIGRARQAIGSWGTGVEVVVVVSPVAPGTTAADASFTMAERPQVLVATDALREVPDPDDRIVSSLVPGEIVTTRDLASGGPHRPLVPPGTRAVALPVDPLTPSLRPGDVVDIVLVHDLLSPVAQSVVPAAVVVDVGEASVTLAVEPGRVADIASTAAMGTVAVALRPQPVDQSADDEDDAGASVVEPESDDEVPDDDREPLP